MSTCTAIDISVYQKFAFVSDPKYLADVCYQASLKIFLRVKQENSGNLVEI